MWQDEAVSLAHFGGGDVNAMFRDIDQLRDEIEDVDENFIEQIRPLLSANQVPTLDRVAARRDRVRRAGGPLALLRFANPAGLADLSALVPVSRLSDPNVGPILNEYETELADRFERLERAARAIQHLCRHHG